MAAGRGGGRPPATPALVGASSVRTAHGLNRRRVLDAAVELIDAKGLRSLTMRGLGAHLGVEAMSLYRYVPSRENLLDGVVETVIDELYGDPEVRMSAPGSDWRDYLRRLANGVRRVALAHPQVFPLVATRPPAAPWVRPPLRSLRWVDAFLETLVDKGFSGPAAVAAYRGFSSFLLGHLLLEVSALGVDTGPTEEADPAQGADASLEGYPFVQELEVELAQDHAATEFEESLENLIERLALLRG